MTNHLPAATFRPLGTLVCLHLFKVTETEGGIRLPDTVVEKMQSETPRGLVVSAGPDCKLVKRGDEILILPGTMAHKVKHDGVEVWVVNEDKIVGIVER